MTPLQIAPNSPLAGLAPDDWALVLPHAVQMDVAKGDWLVRQGAVAPYVFWVQTGIACYRFLPADGSIRTGRLVLDGDFCTDVVSYFTGKPAASGIEALAPCAVLRLDRMVMQEVADKSLRWSRALRHILEHYLMQQVLRTHELQLKTPQQRYEELLVQRPDIVQQVSLKVIAGHLNITQEALSRIRRRI